MIMVVAFVSHSKEGTCEQAKGVENICVKEVWVQEQGTEAWRKFQNKNFRNVQSTHVRVLNLWEIIRYWHIACLTEIAKYLEIYRFSLQDLEWKCRIR